MNGYIQLISKSITSTSEYIQLYHDIEHIKDQEMNEFKLEIDDSYSNVMQLFQFDCFSANIDLLKSLYLCRQIYKELSLKIVTNEKRMSE